MIPEIFQKWLSIRGWQLRFHQTAMVENYLKRKSTLLLAPTGSGKTLAGFLPILIDLYTQAYPTKIHTLYISPLKALANDIHRNLLEPINEMGFNIKVETRTGDTPQSQRKRQLTKPPHILLTTPESLALLLSYPESFKLLKNLKHIIIDEIHSIAANKRGDQTSLLLARLSKIAPQATRVGLSATISDPLAMKEWLDCIGKVELIQLDQKVAPKIDILYGSLPLPLAGHYPSLDLVQEIYKIIAQHKSTLIFVNTRAQAERLFHDIWSIKDENFRIGLHHGSLTKEQRLRIEYAMLKEELAAVVTTSSLDLGVDWGNLDATVHVGAPKGISRLLQRIGRSNHQWDVASYGILVPTNSFEALECQAAVNAIKAHKLDDSPPNQHGALDVLAQHIMSCACAHSLNPQDLFQEVIRAYPYKNMERSVFEDTLNYVVNGGYVLKHYEQYHRLHRNPNGDYEPSSRRIQQRHRMNIGTIVEAEKLKVMLVGKRPGIRGRRLKGTQLGDIEERLILGMEPGDTFLFAGRILRFEQIRDLNVEVTLSNSNQARVPAFLGGKMPLSSHLASSVLALFDSQKALKAFPSYIQEWLEAQKMVSCFPKHNIFLVEIFERQGLHYLTAYTFQGRATNQTLGFVLTHRLENEACQPLSFSVSDYGLSIWCLRPFKSATLDKLFDEKICMDEIEKWLMRSAMLKRFFRTTAVISGLVERKLPGQTKTRKQVTFSTDLIYDVLQKYDPNHLLLRSNRRDVNKELIDQQRLQKFLIENKQRIHYQHCRRITPFAIPIVLEMASESIMGTGMDALLGLYGKQEQAELLYQEALNA